MRPIGFSTGALALGDFRLALEFLRNKPVTAVELSALRLNELEPLIQAANSLDLSKYEYVSVHAPSKIPVHKERWVIDKLMLLRWPIVVHPDAIHSFRLWRTLGTRLLIENMDRRKPIGRTVSELKEVFTLLPEASLCFDIAHARQYDSTMTEAFLILQAFSDRIMQVHMSEVNTSSRHTSMSFGAIQAFRTLSSYLPESAAVILESQVSEDQIQEEVERAKSALGLQEFALV